MRFFVLACSVSLAVWFLAIVTSSLLGWPLRRILLAKSVLRLQRSPGALADALFFLRASPLFLALGFTLGVALPAFLRHEPHSSGEPISSKLWLLACAGALLLAAIMARAARVLWATAKAEKRWRASSERELKIAGVAGRLYGVESESSLLAVAGFFRPRIFVACDVLRLLSDGELRAAVAHEMDHVRRRDNLKQFLLKITRPPRWLGGAQDYSWALASEVAADEGALARGASVLDLASALVKVAALKRGPTLGDQITASHLLPDLPCLPLAAGSPLAARLKRLQEALESPDHRRSEPGRRRWGTIMVVAVSILLYVATVTAALPAVHEGLELLVR